MAKFHHELIIRDNVIIYVPTSIPEKLLPYVKTEHLIKDKELSAFKALVNNSNG
jgi:hypothetical protein